ncbi:MAG: hypothetical protein ACE1ZM_07395 [Gammaproteobacteria bacterium]
MLSSIPSKPGLIIAIIVTMVVLSFYYFKQYRDCTDMASLRSTLFTAVQQNSNGVLRLASIMPFKWERARIIINHQNKGKVLDCPFEWDWTQAQRKQLMANGQLNVIAFARKNINTVVDFSQDMIDFELTETIFTPDSAIFRIEKQGAENTGYLLHQIR